MNYFRTFVQKYENLPEVEKWFEIKTNRKNVERGDILVAEPFMSGDIFSRAVVYMVESSSHGSMGLVLNKALDVGLSEIVKEAGDIHAPVYCGGPVGREHLFYLHTYGALKGSVFVKDGVYFGGDFRELLEGLRTSRMEIDDIRFFAGYSGWESGQLEVELERNIWIVGDMNKSDLFGNRRKDLWAHVLEMMGGKYKLWSYFPENPEWN